MQNPIDPDQTPEEPEGFPWDIRHEEANLDIYFEETYRMNAEIVELYLRYNESKRYNAIIGQIADQTDMLAQILNYETVKQMAARLKAEDDEYDDTEAPYMPDYADSDDVVPDFDDEHTIDIHIDSDDDPIP